MERLFPKFSLCFWIIQLRRAFSHRRGFWPYSFGLWIGLEAELFSVGQANNGGNGPFHSSTKFAPFSHPVPLPFISPHPRYYCPYVWHSHVAGLPLCSPVLAIKRINWWKVYLLNSVLLLFYAFVGFPNCFSSNKSYLCQIPFA